MATAIEELRVIGDYIFNMSEEADGGDTLDEATSVAPFGSGNVLDLTEPSNNASVFSFFYNRGFITRKFGFDDSDMTILV